MSSSSSNSHSPCAACKFLRRKCTQECVFAPYFPPEQPQKFASVHRVYGASNVAKILNDMPVAHREEAVASLAYEAEARLRDPIYGCVAFISQLHARLKHIQAETIAAKKELAAYIGSSHPMIMMYPPPPPSSAAAAGNPFGGGAASGSQLAVLHQFQQQQMLFAAGLDHNNSQSPSVHSQHGFSASAAFVGDGGGVHEGFGVVGNEAGYHHAVQAQNLQVQVVQPHEFHHHDNMLLLNNAPHGQERGVDGNDQER